MDQMIELLFWIVYVVGFLWSWRFVSGAMLNQVTSAYCKSDAFDYILAGLFGAVISSFGWPLIAFLRTSYVVWKKWVPEEKVGTIGQLMFPPPKPVETRADRIRNQLLEKEKELELYKGWVASENAGREGYTFEDYLIDQSG